MRGAITIPPLLAFIAWRGTTLLYTFIWCKIEWNLGICFVVLCVCVCVWSWICISYKHNSLHFCFPSHSCVTIFCQWYNSLMLLKTVQVHLTSHTFTCTHHHTVCTHLMLHQCFPGLQCYKEEQLSQQHASHHILMYRVWVRFNTTYQYKNQKSC